MRDSAKVVSTAVGHRFGGEEVCIRFVNTVAWRRSNAPEDRLGSAGALYRWLVDAGIIGASKDHERFFDKDHIAASDLYRRATELREAIYQLFVSVISRRSPPRVSEAILNGYLAGKRSLTFRNREFRWNSGNLSISHIDLFAPIAWSAAILLSSPRISQVKECGDERGCGWLFLDCSTAGTRVWCSMGDCGNRAKARRHYGRSKGLTAE